MTPTGRLGPDTALQAAAELRHRYEERAAILEYEAGLPRDEAERRAALEAVGLTTGDLPRIRKQLGIPEPR